MTERNGTIYQTLMVGLAFSLAAAIPFGLIDVAVVGWIGAIGGGVGALAAGLGKAWGRWLLLARFWLPLTRRLPWSVIAFLDDAHERGALRQAGAVYQFRHPSLKNHLASVEPATTRR
jgi:hypothetical protein